MTATERALCPVHGMPDCSPLLNGCSRLTAAPTGTGERGHEGYREVMPTAMGLRRFLACETCGALVADVAVHDRWHGWHGRTSYSSQVRRG